MRLALVTAFPPSKGLLNEYGFHIANQLNDQPDVSLTVVGDLMQHSEPELPEFDVIRCWELNRTFNQPRLLKTLRELKPDVVWFNLLFSTFGNANNPAAAFSGLTLPALTRLSGYYTHVTLHHLMDHVDLKDSGITHPRLYRMAGALATRIVLMANSLSVLLPAYRRTLIGKYHGRNVHFRAHGILSARPEPPDYSLRRDPIILVFGKWGTYKKVDLLLEAFPQIQRAIPGVKLVVGGGDHPMAKGYIASMTEQYKDNPDIEFTGYVAEEDIPRLFKTASVLVMPYNSATGASGVAHIGCEYGLPIICADIPDFREMAEDEGLAIEFYRTGDATALAGQLIELLENEDLRREMSEQNFSAALRMTMPQIVQQYLRAFDRKARSRALEPLSRFRRIPAWIPSRSAMYRAAAPRWSAWM
jgi:glycosyltransferase involved in cell wall biosynthesis